jgi:delta24-sterol reductase
MHSFKFNLDLVINVGIWGLGSDDFDVFIRDNRELERKVGELDGKKWSYGHMYYTPEEFWGIYDRGGMIS